MAHLIDKDAVVAEIAKRIKKSEIVVRDIPSSAIFGLMQAYKNVLSFINTLEVKEVDLEKVLKEGIEDVFYDLDGVAVKGTTHYITVEDVKDIAKHFFELGLKAQIGE